MKTQGSGGALPELGYFSFTTLTTLGFGDILPVSPLARYLAVLEGLVGQLFPVILIARLVAMELEYQRHRKRRLSRIAPFASKLSAVKRM